MKPVSAIAIITAVCSIACGIHQTIPAEITVTNKDTSVVTVEIYDTAALVSIGSNATAEVIGRHYTWSEGPVWIAAKNKLLFSDVPENKIYQWTQGDTPTLFLTPSGYTGTVKRNGGEDGSNGLALDKNGNLLLCQSGNRQVVRLSSSLDSPSASFTVLSASYNGKKFNSPNDLVVDSKNNIYFTDPIYGLPKGANDETRELTFEGVYKISSSDGKTSLLIDSIENPNGIGLSRDEKILYIASSSATHPRWFAYNLDVKGNIAGGGLLLDAANLEATATVKQGPDGFKIDRHGNIFSAGPDGINILSPAGKRMAVIKVPKRSVSNCAFNEDGTLLFVTADDYLLKITLRR
jgi:gluconolactonase